MAKVKDEMVKVAGHDVPAHLAKEMEEDSKENLTNVDDAFFRITTQGGRFKVGDQLIGKDGIEFAGVIVREIPVNIYFEKPFDPANPTPPDCWSLGGLKPDVSVEAPQNSSCAACKQNQFGSGIGPDGKPSKGKACGNTRRLVLKVAGLDMLATLSLPPTSKKPFNEYLKGLSASKVPVFALETVFSFDSNVTYPKPLMAMGALLSADEYTFLKEFRTGPEVEAVLKAYASKEDAPSEGEEDGDKF